MLRWVLAATAAKVARPFPWYGGAVAAQPTFEELVEAFQTVEALALAYNLAGHEGANLVETMRILEMNMRALDEPRWQRWRDG